MFLLPIFFSPKSSAQDNAGETGLVDRQPAVAGQFYASNPAQLKNDLAILFSKAMPTGHSNVLALISPHAGYVFSGEVAASSFNQLDPDKQYDNIFILASSHRMSFDGASIYTSGNYKTPLGEVKVNLELARKLVESDAVFNSKSEPHIYEHSLEVQLPFLQYHLKKEFRIVPIIVGTQQAGTCEKIAKALKPYFNDKNLFVISTDFSHYPDYADASEVDIITANAILKNSPGYLVKTLESNDEKGYENLATSLCGWTSVLSLLYMTQDRNDLAYRLVEYRNSGDAEPYGDKDRVVGYCSIVVETQQTVNTGYHLSNLEKADLLNIARSTVSEYVVNGRIPDLDKNKYSDKLKQPSGAFVTLRKDGQLRGCIGRFEATEALYLIVRDMAISASTQDYRFPAVTPEEIDDLEIEISVLTPMRKISSIDEIQLGQHGIYIKKGYSSGTFLPQVATETGWTKEEFLGHCARDKAHIGWDGWKDAEIFVYEAYVFSESELE
jgi:hypothetical protein